MKALLYTTVMNSNQFRSHLKSFFTMKKSIIIATVALCFLAVGIAFQNQGGNQGSNPQSSGPLAEFTSQELAGMPYVIQINGKFFEGNTFNQISTLSEEYKELDADNLNFSQNAKYTYEYCETDNVMDYSHSKRKLTFSTWKWQWEIINNNTE